MINPIQILIPNIAILIQSNMQQLFMLISSSTVTICVAHEARIKHLKVVEDSNLIICQTKGNFSLKKPPLAPYRALTQKLEKKKKKINFEITHDPKK